MTDETKEKLRKHLTGRSLPDATKAKISQTLTGRKNPPPSQDTRDKIAQKHKGRKHTADARQNMSAATRPAVSEETCSKLSQKMKEVWAKRKEVADGSGSTEKPSGSKKKSR